MAWFEWERGRRLPRDYNYVGIDTAMEWETGGVDAILDGRDPAPLPKPTARKPPPLTKLELLIVGIYRQLRADGRSVRDAQRSAVEIGKSLKQNEAVLIAAMKQEEARVD